MKYNIIKMRIFLSKNLWWPLLQQHITQSN